MISNKKIIEKAKELHDLNPRGFYVSDLFESCYPGEPIYYFPDRSHSPTLPYTKFIKRVKTINKLIKVSPKKYGVKDYIPTPTIINNPNGLRPGWLRRFIQWVW